VLRTNGDASTLCYPINSLLDGSVQSSFTPRLVHVRERVVRAAVPAGDSEVLEDGEEGNWLNNEDKEDFDVEDGWEDSE
jgi:hypothetical protein